MTALITTSGKIRILTLLTNDTTHIGFGNPDPGWSDDFNPPAEDVTATNLAATIGYVPINTRGWLIADPSGSILIDNVTYSISGSPTTIAYVAGTIPSGMAEGVVNKIGQIGVFGQNVVTTALSGATWIPVNQIATPGTLFRIQNIAVFVKPDNSVMTFNVAFPLLV